MRNELQIRKTEPVPVVCVKTSGSRGLARPESKTASYRRRDASLQPKSRSQYSERGWRQTECDTTEGDTLNPSSHSGRHFEDQNSPQMSWISRAALTVNKSQAHLSRQFTRGVGFRRMNTNVLWKPMYCWNICITSEQLFVYTYWHWSRFVKPSIVLKIKNKEPAQRLEAERSQA